MKFLRRPHRTAHLLRPLLPLLGLLALAPAFPQQPVTAFSLMAPGTELVGWQVQKPAPRAADTRYTLVDDQGTTVLKADAISSMTALAHPVHVKGVDAPLLRWRWKVEAPVAAAEMGSREGDDYAARIYVLFDYPMDRLPLLQRLKLQLGELVFKRALPKAALHYVWDNRQPVGSILTNPHTERARMIVVQSGGARAGEWVVETRDVAADFRAAFGEDPPDIIGIALATDTDNTGASATAWYGDIAFVAREAQDATPDTTTPTSY